jgi:quercetin dioxygenase-like cupin family protein
MSIGNRWTWTAAAVVLLAGVAAAGGTERHVTHTPDQTQWGPGPESLPAGAQAAVLDGNPKEKGAFVMRLKVPEGFTIAPHTHPRHERVTVISGRFQLGHGRTFDAAGLRDLPAGSFFSMPPGMEHFARAAEDTVVQLNGEGPWEIVYVNPADDPRRARRTATR